jgi:hypothetical protein
MTRRANPLERVRDANPVPGLVEPNWGSVRERVAGEEDGGLAGAQAAANRRRRVSLSIGVLAGLALCAAATIVVLALAPSGGSSDFLARAAAALTPASGTLLYERWETTIAPEAGNPERRQAVTFGPEQLWIEGDHPRRYRTVLLPRSGPPEGRRGGVGLAYAYGVTLSWSGGGFHPRRGGVEVLTRLQRAITGQPLELGGTVEAPRGTTNPDGLQPTLTFLPSNKLLRARLRVALGPSLPGPHDQIIENGADPVGALRGAIAEGRARVAGTTQLDGRTVQRIDIHLPQQLPADAPPLPPGHPVIHAEAFAYVQPETFHPLEIVYGGQTYRFLAYEYLPASTANLALTDIHAQHPRARILDTIRAPHGTRPRKPYR